LGNASDRHHFHDGNAAGYDLAILVAKGRGMNTPGDQEDQYGGSGAMKENRTHVSCPAIISESGKV
jgi:hypothetical protein